MLGNGNPYTAKLFALLEIFSNMKHKFSSKGICSIFYKGFKKGIDRNLESCYIMGTTLSDE